MLAATLSKSRLPSWLFLLLVATLTLGCSAGELYGDQVKYAPSYRGYVFAPESPTDDPERDTQVVLLRNPVTQRKIRCREELERWVMRYRSTVLDDVHDDNWMVGSILIMAPATLIAAAAMDVAVIGIGIAELPFSLARSETGDELYERGAEAFENGDYRSSVRWLELALTKGHRRLSAYYLGLAYAKLGDNDAAVEALEAFVERSSSQEVTAYRNAERWLRWLDAPVEPCRSTKPMSIAW